jgi:hypothetical protein
MTYIILRDTFGNGLETIPNIGVDVIEEHQLNDYIWDAAKIINAQRWECCETGYVSTAAGVVHYQKAKSIDTSKNNRRRIA